MSLTALVAAYDADAGGLRAMRPLAGATIIEHQIRRLAAAGAGRIMLLLDDWPPALSPILLALRADGIAVDTATRIADLADRLAAEPRILLLADGCLPDRALIERMAAASGPSLATLADTPDHAGYERIDATARWAGIAMIDGRLLVDTASMVGDWDPVSTLLRRAVQQDAARVDAGTAAPVMTGQGDAIAGAEAVLIAQTRERPLGWAARLIEGPIAAVLLPLALARLLRPGWVAGAAAALPIGGGALAVGGLPLTGLILTLPSGALARIAARMTLIQARRIAAAKALAAARCGGLALGAIGIGLGLRAGDGQWGWVLLAAGLTALLAATGTMRRVTIATASIDLPDWAATVTAMPWLLLPFGLTGRWDAGLAIAALYAAATLGWQMATAARSLR